MLVIARLLPGPGRWEHLPPAAPSLRRLESPESAGSSPPPRRPGAAGVARDPSFLLTRSPGTFRSFRLPSLIGLPEEVLSFN